MSLTRRIVNESLPVTVLAMAGRAVGLVVPLLVARWFGTVLETDAFYLACAVPLVLGSVFQTTVAGLLVPVFSRVRSEAPDHGSASFNGYLLPTLIGTSGVTLLLSAAAPALLGLIAGTHQDLLTLSLEMLAVMLPAIPLAGTAAVCRAWLDSAQLYRISSLLPVARGLVQLGYLVICVGEQGAHALPVSYLFGEMAYCLFSLLALFLPGSGYRLTGMIERTISIPIVGLGLLFLGELAVNLNGFVDRSFAAALPIGHLSAFEYASRLIVIPETALSSGLLVVALAQWSIRGAGGNWREVERSLDRLCRWLVILVVPTLLGTALMLEHLVDLVLGGGKFGEDAVRLTSQVVLCLLPGFAPMMIGALLARYLLIRQQLGPVYRVGFAGFVINALLDAILIGPLGLMGLGLATSIRQCLVTALLLKATQTQGANLLRCGFSHWMIRFTGVQVLIAGAVWGVLRIAGAALPTGVAAVLSVVVFGGSTVWAGLREWQKNSGEDAVGGGGPGG